MKQPDFLYFDTKSQNVKVDGNFFGWTWSKMGAVGLVMGL